MRSKYVLTPIIGVSCSLVLLSCGKRIKNDFSTQNLNNENITKINLNSDFQKPDGIVPPDFSNTLALGSGYDSKSQERATKCIEGDVRYVGQHSMETNIYHNMDMNALVNDLSGNINGQAQYSIFRACLKIRSPFTPSDLSII